MKRIFIITLFLLINVFIFSEECFLISYNEYDFYLIENNLYISAYNGSDRDIILPDNVLGYPVIGIAPTAFSENIELQSVIIPDSIKIIGDFAFEYCRKLGDVKMSDSIEVIGNYAFSNCHSLTLISLPQKLNHIGDRAFQNCGQLFIENMPATIEKIGAYAFWNCRPIKQFVLPSTIKDIGEHAFSYCQNLVLKVEENSYAHDYAIENNVCFEVY